MITHIVLFKLKDGSKEAAAKAREALLGLNGRVPVLRHLEVGCDVVHSGRSYDIALMARFDSLEDLDAYQNHPEHVAVAEYMAKVREEAVAVDYES